MENTFHFKVIDLKTYSIHVRRKKLLLSIYLIYLKKGNLKIWKIVAKADYIWKIWKIFDMEDTFYFKVIGLKTYTFEEDNYYYPFVSNENMKETSQIHTYIHSNPFHSILDSRTVLTINQKRTTFRSNANRNAFETVGKVAQRNTWKEGRYVRNRLIPLGRCRSQWRGARDRKKGVKDGPSRKPVHTYTWGGLALT